MINDRKDRLWKSFWNFTRIQDFLPTAVPKRITQLKEVKKVIYCTTRWIVGHLLQFETTKFWQLIIFRSDNRLLWHLNDLLDVLFLTNNLNETNCVKGFLKTKFIHPSDIWLNSSCREKNWSLKKEPEI